MVRGLQKRSTWFEELEQNHLWYLVGVIASDGCLSKDGRHIVITSKDYEFLEALKGKLNLPSKIAIKRGGSGKQSYHIQMGNKSLYNFLVRIGLMPSKSLRLGPIAVPDQYFLDFLRGVIDGDGNIRRWIHPTNGREQWVLRIYSYAERFARWLYHSIRRLMLVKGAMHIDGRGRNPQYTLKYGKMAARIILDQCYYQGALSLKRKV